MVSHGGTSRLRVCRKENPVSLKPKPCRDGCGQDVILVELNGHWRPMSVEPVPLASIHPDYPAVAWLRDGSMIDARCAQHAPRMAYPPHLCSNWVRSNRRDPQSLDDACLAFGAFHMPTAPDLAGGAS